MAQSNSELRAIAEAVFGAIDAGDLDAFLAFTTEDVEFTSLVAEAEGATFHGHDGVRAWWETVPRAFDQVSWEVLDVRGVGDRAVVHLRIGGVMSGVPVEQGMWQAVQLRDGKARWWRFFRSEREALEAAGLA